MGSSCWLSDPEASEVTMEWSVQVWRVALAALIALAVILVWPPLGSEAASPTVHEASPAFHSHATRAEENSPQRVIHGNMDADCYTSAICRCAMTHCHSGISVEPHKMATFTFDDETIAAAAVQRLGSSPDVVLPPPRHLPVRSLTKSN